jgi:YggT family protein
MPTLLLTFLNLLVVVLVFLIFARAVVSWTNPRGGGNLTAFLYQATEPLLSPIRRVFPPTGGLDWAPMIAIVLLSLLSNLLLH